jgi:hypothetical protein
VCGCDIVAHHDLPVSVAASPEFGRPNHYFTRDWTDFVNAERLHPVS